MTRPAETEVDILDSAEAGGRFIRGGALRLGTFVLQLALSLAAVPFMIRHLGPVDYGYFVTASAIVFVIAGVTEAGLTNLGVREYATGPPGQRERVLRNLVGMRLALTGAGLAFAAGLTAVTGSPPVVVAGVAISGLGLLIAMIQQTYGIPLAADLRLGWASSIELTKQALLSIGTILLVIVGATLVPFFTVSVVASLATLVMTVIVVRRGAVVGLAADYAVWKELLRETLPYAVATAVGIIYFREAVILMSYLASDLETGYYSAAFRIVEILGTVPWMLITAVFPILARAARDDHQRLRYALQRLFEVALIIGSLMSLTLAVGAEFAIHVVAGHGFEPSIEILRIQSIALVTSFIVAVFAFTLLSLRLHKELLVANGIAVVVATVATLVLVPPFGAHGAAVAPTAAEACLGLSYAVALRRAKPELTVSLGIVPRVLVAVALGLVAGIAVPLPSVVQAAVAGLVCFGMLLALRAIPFELWNALRRRSPEPTG